MMAAVVSLQSFGGTAVIDQKLMVTEVDVEDIDLDAELLGTEAERVALVSQQSHELADGPGHEVFAIGTIVGTFILHC
jgi:hypothetical protein